MCLPTLQNFNFILYKIMPKRLKGRSKSQIYTLPQQLSPLKIKGK